MTRNGKCKAPRPWQKLEDRKGGQCVWKAESEGKGADEPGAGGRAEVTEGLTCHSEEVDFPSHVLGE